MKLWLKMFLMTLLLSALSLIIGAAILITRVHIQNIDSERDRAVSEFDLMTASIKTAAAESPDTLKAVVERFSDYYSARGVWLSLVTDGGVAYDGIKAGGPVYSSLMDPKDEILGKIESIGTRRCMLLSVRLPGNEVLVYIRDISGVYLSRADNIRLFSQIAVGLTLLIALLAYAVSKSVTRPLDRLRRGADALAAGDYEAVLAEGRDEIGALARSFNIMTKAVRERESELKERAEERQLFIDDMSHEMNTPLTSIQGYAELLQNANITDGQRHMAVRHIQTETHRIKEMYKKLMVLTLTKEFGAEYSEFGTADLFREVAEELAAAIKGRCMNLETRIEKGSLAGDKTLLHLLLSNLVRNSIAYSPDGSTITMSAYPAADMKTVLEVADHGIGIPQDKLEKVMEPFYRVDKSRSRRSGGAGLGLAICKKIAEAHGGALQIESEPDAGTTVRMIF
jgi:signal transduction histidine kinase